MGQKVVPYAYGNPIAMDLIRNDVTNKDGRDSWGTLYSK